MAAHAPPLQGSVGGVEHVALLSVLTGSALGLYLRVVYADPGSVPQGWLPDAEAAAAAANGQPGGAAPPPLGSLFVEVKRKGDAVRTPFARCALSLSLSVSRSLVPHRGPRRYATAPSAATTSPRGRTTADSASAACCGWTTTAPG